MSRKAVVQVQVSALSEAQEPTVTALLLHGALSIGMEADWQGILIVIRSLQIESGDSVDEFSSLQHVVTISIHISDPAKLLQLSGQRLTFWSERSIPVIDPIHSWQTESTS